jgi:hypothetical protein
VVALGILFTPVSLTARQYDACVKQLEAVGAGMPAGRIYHACFGSDGHLRVFDIWDSMAAFERFGKTLMPILKDLGVDPGQPAIGTIHHVIPG